ncbi:hypothetical protein AHAS_Ahas14G0155500 [Arachis hypogaea]
MQGFKQGDNESLHDAWGRYRRMLRKCPNKIFSEWVQLDIFYYGLSDMAKISLDHSAGGSIHERKTTEEAHELIEIVATNQHLYSSVETPIKGEVKAISIESNPPEQDGPLTQQLHALSHQILELQEATAIQDIFEDVERPKKNVIDVQRQEGVSTIGIERPTGASVPGVERREGDSNKGVERPSKES